VSRIAALLIVLCTTATSAFPESATITFFRERSEANPMPEYKFRLLVDDKDVAKLGVDQFITIQVAPGPHRISTRRWGLGKVISPGEASGVSIDLKPGERVFIHPRLFPRHVHPYDMENVESLSCPEAMAIVVRGDHREIKAVKDEKISKSFTSRSPLPVTSPIVTHNVLHAIQKTEAKVRLNANCIIHTSGITGNGSCIHAWSSQMKSGDVSQMYKKDVSHEN
jgi:hypothetical protein